jgi:hypothetical protein
MSFLKKLFGGSSGGEPSEPAEQIEHEGYLITPTPIAEGGQYRLAADISREMDGQIRTHRLVRADLFMSRQEASEAALRKAKQVIREQGDAMFDTGTR